MTHFYIGVDLGQRKNYTAIAVVQRSEPVLARFDYVTYLRRQERLAAEYAVRHLERVSLGTPYPGIVERLREIERSPELRGRSTLVVDATGVGQPVVDLLRDSDIDCELAAVLITAGFRARKEGGMWHVPKRDLIGTVQVMVEQKRLKLAADLPRLETLIEELMEMKMRVTPEGGEQYGVWRAGKHDDLALALALACWRAAAEDKVVGERAEPLRLL
jgi:hypothetical protein